MQNPNQEIKKVVVGFSLLQSGLISTMTDEDFDKVMEYLK